MNRLNRRKGFTLIELIVVIVIIAILVAALTPAILGVIERANIAVDEADARSVMMVCSVAAVGKKPPKELKAGVGDEALFLAEMTGAANLHSGDYYVFFDGPIGVGCTLHKGRSRISNETPSRLEIGTTKLTTSGNPNASAIRIILTNSDGVLNAMFSEYTLPPTPPTPSPT